MRGATVAFPDYGVYATPELLAAFVAAPSRLRRAADGMSEAELRARPRGPTTWSIQEILLHTADSELQGAFRMRRVWAEPGALLPIYDQAEWAGALDYQAPGSEAREHALALFSLLRAQSAALLARATAEDWGKWGTHPEYGPVTLRNLLELYADHGERHLEQVLVCRRLLGDPLAIEPLLARRLY